MSEETVNVDWLGNPYTAGTYVVYAASGGRSINMIFGRVIRINPTGTVAIQPLKSSRWKHHSETTRYIDKRTGKGIDYWNDAHVETPSWYRHDLTGREVQYQDRWDHNCVWHKPEDRYTYIPQVMKDYVEEIKVPVKPVTLTVTENITVWLGHLPEGVEE